ncbi:MAG: ferritin [Phycisphaerae bacterium]
MLDAKIQGAFNKHLNAEFFSSYLYLSMSAYFESQSLRGMAKWMRMQAREENVHAMKFFNFIIERKGTIALTQIDAPPLEWSSPAAAVQAAYEHECEITGLINDLVNLAVSAKDHATNAFLQWFVTEQVEEESSVQEIVERLRLVGDSGPALLMVDRELGGRTS